MPKKLLAVDDDPGTLQFYRDCFEDEDFIVKTAPDATAAIMLCGEFNPDILLLDWDMPGGGGRRVFEKVCGLLGKDIPVLFVTGAPDKVDVDAVSGKISILKKPANVATLLSHAQFLIKQS